MVTASCCSSAGVPCLPCIITTPMVSPCAVAANIRQPTMRQMDFRVISLPNFAGPNHRRPYGFYLAPARWSNSRHAMSAFGTKRTSRCAQLMSALGSKADVGRRRLKVCFWPKADIGPQHQIGAYTGNAGGNNIGAAPLAARTANLQRAHPLNRRTRMAAPEEINADMLAFWNGKGGHTWVARQEHTDITLAPVTDALLGFAAPRAGERVVDIGCGCGAPTLEFARAVGPSGRVVGFDISRPMLVEGERRQCRRPRQCRLAAGRSCHRRAG